MFNTLFVLVIVAVGFAASSTIDVPANCRQDEESYFCANLINPTCADPDTSDWMISRSDCKYACTCKTGLVRPVPGSSECIPIKDCEKRKHENSKHQIGKDSKPIAEVRSTNQLSPRREIKHRINYQTDRWAKLRLFPA